MYSTAMSYQFKNHMKDHEMNELRTLVMKSVQTRVKRKEKECPDL